MAVSAFSDDGKYYSSISKDGRLRIWDTETNVLKQEYTPDLHLTSPPSCLQWISVSTAAGSSQKSGKRKQSFSETQCIALGTTNGKILIYSVTQAKVENVITEENSGNHQNNITALDWSRKYGLFSANKAGFVFEWDLHSGSVRNKYNVKDSQSKQGNCVSSIRIVPHNQQTQAKYIVTTSWQVCVWRLHDGAAILLRHLGHNPAPRALTMLAQLNNSCWLIEGSQNERLLSFWDVTITEDHLSQLNGDDSITPSKRQRRKSVPSSSPSYNFVLEDAPQFVDVGVKAEGGGSMLRLAAVTRSGVVHFYGHMLNGASSKPIKPSVTVQVTTADANPLPLRSCRLDNADLLVGYTNGPALVFEKITPDTSSKTQVLIRGEAKPQKKKGKQAQTNEVNKVRSDPTADVTYVEPMGGVTRKRTAPGGQVEVPMEARLQNLSLDPKARGGAVAHNLAALLAQGLHSADKSLILTVLQKNDPAVAKRTVSALPADYVPLLLEQLADMATRKTSQCGSVCTWASATLRAHSALLLAAGHSRTAHRLTQLLALFTYRRSHLCQLLNLKGRLELTSAQRASRDDAHAEQEAVLEYNDTSSDEEMELEVEQYQSDSAASWGDDADSSAHDLDD